MFTQPIKTRLQLASLTFTGTFALPEGTKQPLTAQMGTPEAAKELLQHWVVQAGNTFSPESTQHFAAIFGLQAIRTAAGQCTCNVKVSPRLQASPD